MEDSPPEASSSSWFSGGLHFRSRFSSFRFDVLRLLAVGLREFVRARSLNAPPVRATASMATVESRDLQKLRLRRWRLCSFGAFVLSSRSSGSRRLVRRSVEALSWTCFSRSRDTSKILTLFIETPRLRVFLPKQLTRGTSTQSRELATVSAKTGRHHLHPNRHQYAHRQDHRRPSPELFPFSFMNRFLGELSHRAGQGRHSPSSSPHHHRVACHYRACCQRCLESTALPKTGCTAPFFVFFETGFLSDLGHTVLPSTLRQPPPEVLPRK
ncbi:hypothetical protein LR48_Vigan07g199700 [Vigna angularis]|uniref:Uncharacterized protein n=1 Tax=Phaseolus angularis TaxID=3914 RepID=A0A0L9UZT8_PHAAN|nr:hypothetical protein LR48_Vigan07g199700 [Vigna angularis]